MSKKTAKPSGASAPSASTSRREALRRQQEAEAARARRMRIISLAAALLALALVAVVGTVWYNDHRTKVKAASAQGTPKNALADKSGISVNPGKAKAGAPTLTIYFDYQCPYCKHAEEKLGTTINTLAAKGDINLEYRTMTFLDTNLRNDSSSRAAVAAACSDNAGAYAKYHDVVFQHQPTQEGVGYTDQQLRADFAQQAGITGSALTDFQACYDAKATQDFVKGVDEKAAKAGVTSTPTYRVNGKDLDWKNVPADEQGFLDAVKKLAA